MKLTSTQLRQIIKEEISRVSRKQESKNYPVRETESVLAAFEDLKGRETNLESGVLLDDLAFSLSTTSENLIKSAAFKDSGLVVKVVEKGQITANESTAYRKGMLLEGHNRITPEEMNAWMSGDWGFVSEDASSKLYNSQTAWVDAVRDDDRTIGELLDAHDDMTKTPLRGYDVTVSSSAFHDLLPHADLKISELEDATVIERVDALIKDLKSLAVAIDNDR